MGYCSISVLYFMPICIIKLLLYFVIFGFLLCLTRECVLNHGITIVFQYFQIKIKSTTYGKMTTINKGDWYLMACPRSVWILIPNPDLSRITVHWSVQHHSAGRLLQRSKSTGLRTQLPQKNERRCQPDLQRRYVYSKPDALGILNLCSLFLSPGKGGTSHVSNSAECHNYY